MSQKNILQKDIEFRGKGLHTGVDVIMTLKPSEEGAGITFKRVDLSGTPSIKADVQYVTTTQRGTTLQSGETIVSTVEHVLAALHGLSIEDVLIEINGPEIPIMDGSAIDFTTALLSSGLEHTESSKDPYKVEEAFVFTDEKSGAEYAVFPSDTLDISAHLSFKEEALGEMVARMNDKDQFAEAFADSRTFVFLSEIESLFDAGLIKGGDIDNAVTVIDSKMSDSDISKLCTKLGKPELAANAEGFLNAPHLRHKNEPARHKVLDILGDLALIGRPLQAKIIATKPGHTGNVALARVLKEKYNELKKNQGRPYYDPNAIPLMSIEDIKALLPHRYPFLMIDKVIELSATHIVGVKNVTGNENFFEGHFPGNPIFPGVLQMEALAQTGGILALNSVEDKGGWDTYFLKMDGVKFKAKVVPGDTLILKMELLAPIRRGIVQMYGTAYVGNKLVSEGELTAQIVKRAHDQ
jgi:UDP-3-O-[3-hydroxymyristoyl] N-acetylglucosamine deacetylase / 3-hydroxyacyl-[acyl-carrier-protein] dehydratase